MSTSLSRSQPSKFSLKLFGKFNPDKINNKIYEKPYDRSRTQIYQSIKEGNKKPTSATRFSCSSSLLQ